MAGGIFMKAGSMEGLIGASINMEISKTPMRVYKEAERRGDTAVMERAMGYVTDFQEKAKECSNRAQEELAKELKEEHKEQETKREQAALKRKAEQKEYEEKIQQKNKDGALVMDNVEISEEGKVVLKNNLKTEELTPVVESTDIKMYTSDGKPISTEQASVSIDTKIGE